MPLKLWSFCARKWMFHLWSLITFWAMTWSHGQSTWSVCRATFHTPVKEVRSRHSPPVRSNPSTSGPYLSGYCLLYYCYSTTCYSLSISAYASVRRPSLEVDPAYIYVSGLIHSSDGSFANESIWMNDSLTKTSWPDFSLSRSYLSFAETRVPAPPTRRWRWLVSRCSFTDCV